MKKKSTVIYGLLAVFQPLLWWFIDLNLTHFYNIKTTTEGLDIVCIISGIIVTIGLGLLIANNEGGLK